MTKKFDQKKFFFDPHPGFAGAVIPIPAAVKKVADELNNKTMTLKEAIAKIRAVTGGKVTIVKKYNFITKI